MKHKMKLRLLSIALTLGLLVLALPVAPVMALQAGVISIGPSSGPPGTTVAVSGAGFTADTGVIVFFGPYVATTTTADSGGQFYVTFTVPTLARGNYSVSVTTGAADTSTARTYSITPQITAVSPTLGYVGVIVTVSGSGFFANSSVAIKFAGTTKTTTTATANGVISNATFTVPASAKGAHAVTGVDIVGATPAFNFTTQQKITISPTSGGVGDTLTINGTGFAASRNVTFFFDGVSVSAGTTTTDTNGSFTNSAYVIPASSRGVHTIKANDASGNLYEATFTVGHKITLTPTSGKVGDTVVVTGSGFDAAKTITITYGGTTVTTTTTGSTGSFSTSFTVPGGAAGVKTVTASDGTYSASASFVATFSATISQITSASSPGNVGMELTIGGTGFLPNTAVTVTYATDPVTIGTVIADASGSFSVVVTIPESVGGTHIITVSDGTNAEEFNFFMEQDAPSTPSPLLPEMGVKAQQPVVFDWGDVTDLSGVTYTFQLATDANFTVLTLEKTGLTTSGYTLTEAEELESVSKDTPYHWRVKAIDGASNEGAWTGVGTFYVGFSFDLDNWIWWLVGGIGVIIIVAIGFLMGRKSVTY